MSSDAPLNTHDVKKQVDNNTPPGVVNQLALSPQEVEHISKAFTKHAPLRKEQGVQDNTPRSEKKTRHFPPQIDFPLQLKWGLALLGEEKAIQYLEWLYAKLTRGEKQDSGV